MGHLLSLVGGCEVGIFLRYRLVEESTHTVCHSVIWTSSYNTWFTGHDQKTDLDIYLGGILRNFLGRWWWCVAHDWCTMHQIRLLLVLWHKLRTYHPSIHCVCCTLLSSHIPSFFTKSTVEIVRSTSTCATSISLEASKWLCRLPNRLLLLVVRSSMFQQFSKAMEVSSIWIVTERMVGVSLLRHVSFFYGCQRSGLFVLFYTSIFLCLHGTTTELHFFILSLSLYWYDAMLLKPTHQPTNQPLLYIIIIHVKRTTSIHNEQQLVPWRLLVEQQQSIRQP